MTFFAIAAAQYNASTTPSVPWFPIVVWGVLFSLVFWINGKWDIGLALPKGKPWGLIAAFAIMSTLVHFATIFAFDIILWAWGPWDLAIVGTGVLIATAVIGLATFTASIYLARQIKAIS